MAGIFRRGYVITAVAKFYLVTIGCSESLAFAPKAKKSIRDGNA